MALFRPVGPLWFSWNTAEIGRDRLGILAEGAGGLVVLMVVTSISILLKALIIRVLAERLNFANGLIGALQRS
ncbi:MAG: hypothetical protein O2807_01080 [bacterium]|nr:hypothetical protein [bacterium]